MAVLPDIRTTGHDLMQRLVADSTGQAVRQLLLENYAAMPAAFEPGLRDLIDSIVDERELPLLISCRAGQDRTGFVAHCSCSPWASRMTTWFRSTSEATSHSTPTP